MSTNPNNAVGTNGAFGGRTSVNALNDVLAAFSGSGILSGWKCVPSSGMTVQIGGQDADIRDAAIAEDPYGNRTTINNISQQPISITLSAASASSNRYTSIVAYVNSPTNASDTALDNPTVVGLIAVDGVATTNPTKPTDAQIRTAITVDGGTGSAAYYVKLADIYIEAGLTTITASYIIQENMEVGLSASLGKGIFRDYTQLFEGTRDLYDTSTINLYADATDFDYLRLTFINNDDDIDSIDVRPYVGRYINISANHLEAGLTVYNTKLARLRISSSNTLAIDRRATQFSTNGSPSTTSGLLLLTGVYGYNVT